ncbi:MAG: GNAT family N-acetyltransferase [Bacteroidia bacterium]
MRNTLEINIDKITNKNQLEAAWKIRKQVFVIEQNCPEEIEWEFEDESTHFLASIINTPVATARWRTTPNGIKLERFAVLKEYRKYGIGSKLLKAILEDIMPTKNKIYLHAQTHAAEFYAKHGFAKVGELFMEADIEHIKMEFVNSF